MGFMRKKIKVSPVEQAGTLHNESEDEKKRRIKLFKTKGKDAGEEVLSVKRKGLLGN